MDDAHQSPKRTTPPARRRPNVPADVDAQMLDLLVCPVTRGPLRRVGEELVSLKARQAYPIRNGVPVLVSGEAREVDEDEATRIERGT